MKNSLKSMVLTLFVITFIASAGVNWVYTITKKPIAAAKAAARVTAMERVLPEFDYIETSNVTLDGVEIAVNSAYLDTLLVGYAVESTTRLGYSGMFSIMSGLTPEGEVITIDVIEHKETPGLGSKMTNEGNALLRSVVGRNLNDFALVLRKDGGEVDGLTAATITSRAYLDALERAFRAITAITTAAEVTIYGEEDENEDENEAVEDENNKVYYDYGKAYISGYIK